MPQETIIARSGDVAIALVEMFWTGTLSERPFSVARAFRCQLSPKAEITRVVISFDHIFVTQLREKAEELGVTEDDLHIEIAIQTIGEYLDEGNTIPFVKDGQRSPIIDADRAAQSYFDRSRATELDDETILAYIAKKSYWAWRFGQTSCRFGLADTKRLGISLGEFGRVAIAGDGVYWQRPDKDGLELTPTAKLLSDVPGGAFPGIGRPLLPRVADRLQAPRYEASRKHFDRALELFDDSPPDLANAVKEAVAAVESLALLVVGRSSGTLGDCLKDLKAKQLVKPQLMKALEALWGYASEEPGVRHGKTLAPNVDQSEAVFMLSMAASAVVLLLELDR